MAHQSQIFIHTPQFSTRSAHTRLHSSTHVPRSCSFKPGTASPNGIQCMSIAIAKFGPAIYLSIGSHCQAICIDATKAGVPRLYAIKPDITVLKNTIQYFALATMTEDRIERVSYYRQPSLLMHKVDAALHTQIGRNAFFNEERQHMALPGADFLPYNKVNAINTYNPEITCPQSTLYHIMIGKRDNIQIGIMLDMMQDLLNSANTIAITTVHMQISPAQHA